ncbi:FMN-dependent NADH-azoreductase [Anthocerotibacter panamensis]|uniref:FMN-dependent NADH-azoreductase n=1 Tax=Anthocerotibacter panamensis TaxID=2857077 RepID=UPI001C405639|nr:FMN-dependent NADH-azoreductase [Anthocerotibacter panamensis]
MAHILHIDSSPRGDRSHSRTLAQEFITAWKTAHPEDTFSYRDLGHAPVPHVDEAWIAAAFTPPDARTPELDAAIKTSDALIDEFLAADRYVFSVPMYNLNIPSTFKAYIDQIVRAGRTFGVTSEGYKGLVEGRKLLIITARGGMFRPGTPAASYDFQEPYLRGIFGFMGVTDVTFIHADGLNLGDAFRTQSLADAQKALQVAATSW